MSFPGDRLKKLRKDRGMNQTQFASLIGISQTFLSDLENNNSTMTEVVLNSIEYKVGANKEWVKTGKGGKFLYIAPGGKEGLISEPQLDTDMESIMTAFQKIPVKHRPATSKNIVSFIELLYEVVGKS